MADGERGERFADVGVFVEVEAELVFADACHPGGALARGEAFFGLAGELGFGNFDGENVLAAFPDVFRREFDAARQEITKFAEFAQRFDEAAAQAVHVCAAAGGGDEVGVALKGAVRARAFAPGEGEVDLAFVVVMAQGVGFGGQGVAASLFAQVGGEAVLVAPFVVFAADLVVEADVQSGAEHGFGFQRLFEAGDSVVRRVKVAFVNPEAHAGAVAAFADGFHSGERFDDFAVGADEAVAAAVALDFDFQTGGEGVHHGDADAVQAAGVVVVFAAEFAARVQAGEDEFDAADAFFGVDIDRHAAAVVAYRERAVGVQGNADGARVTGKRFIDAVVDDFLREVIGAGGVSVHARSATDGVEAF